MQACQHQGMAAMTIGYTSTGYDAYGTYHAFQQHSRSYWITENRTGLKDEPRVGRS